MSRLIEACFSFCYFFLLIAQHQENLFICLAAVLNMGNIEFGQDDNEYSFVKDKTGPLTTVAVSNKLYLLAYDTVIAGGHY